MAYAIKYGGRVTPLTGLIDPALLIEGGRNTIVFEQDEAVRDGVFRLFATNHSPQSGANSLRDLLCCLPRLDVPAALGYENISRVLIMQFIDAYSFDVRDNPLFVAARFGPKGDGDIFIPTAMVVAQQPRNPNFAYGPVTDAAMSNTIFTGSDLNTRPPGFGGPQTGFWPGGVTSSGNLESDPHNLVHVYIGGNAPAPPLYGLMADPGTAALDPIFYLHHANIDRMWVAWNASGRADPRDPAWLNGPPAAAGDREFVMPMPDGSEWVYAPTQVTSTERGDYTYDDVPQLAPPLNALRARLARLGASTEGEDAEMPAPGENTELVGATQQAVPITGAGATTTVRLAPAVQRKVTESLATADSRHPPDRLFLQLENVLGTHDASVLSVYINLPENEPPAAHPELLAGSVGLFGLRRASTVDAPHGGQGLTFVLELTDIVDRLHVRNAIDEGALKVTIVPHQPMPEPAEVTVGRISMYRQGA
jgi:tyrosinase